MNKPENSSIINVCVIPDARVSEECAVISQSLKNENTMFTLGEGLFAHMTVYMARFADGAVSEVVEGVKEVVANIESFPCEHTGYFMTAGRYLEVSYRKSDAFMRLHEAIIARVSDLRINPGDPYEEGYFTPYTAEQQVNAQETGYDLARGLYRPHVTLTRYREGGVPKAFPGIPEANLSFSLGKISVYKADDNGAIYELLDETFVKQQ